MKSGIYKITNTNSCKFYIGSSSNIEKRWRTHRSELNRNKHHSNYLQNAWNKYGEESFKFEVLFECSKEDLSIHEQTFIDNLNPSYNMALKVLKPMQDRKHTNVAKLKISKSRLGYKHTDEAKAKMSMSRMGKSCITESGRKRMSEYGSGKVRSLGSRLKQSNTMLGHVINDETKIKISNKFKERMNDCKGVLPLSSRNTSGVTGVKFNKRANKWQASINFENKRISLGYFENLEDGRIARKNAEAKYFGKEV